MLQTKFKEMFQVFTQVFLIAGHMFWEVFQSLRAQESQEKQIDDYSVKTIKLQDIRMQASACTCKCNEESPTVFALRFKFGLRP